MQTPTNIIQSSTNLTSTQISANYNGEMTVTLELLDPVGHSQILHEDAVSSEISEAEAKNLDPGPVYPVFDVSE